MLSDLLKNDWLIQVTFDHVISVMRYYANTRMASAMLEQPVSQIYSVNNSSNIQGQKIISSIKGRLCK